MLERADVVLAAIPILAFSGVAFRTVISLAGVGTGLLAAPLTPAGFLAAFEGVLRELLWVPAVSNAGNE